MFGPALAALVAGANPPTSAFDLGFEGDLWLRGYTTDRLAAAPVRGDESANARLRATTTATSAAHLRAVLTVQADAYWDDPARDDRSRVALGELYAELEEIAWTPISLRVGRQLLHSDSGLFFTDREEAWSFDAAHATLDRFPWTANLVYGTVSSISPVDNTDNFWWARIGHEGDTLATSLYSGNPGREADGNPTTIGGRLERIVSVHEDPATVVVEVAHQSSPADAADDSWLVDVSAEWQRSRARWQPTWQARWTWASGDREEAGGAGFREAYSHLYWGRALKPRLTNVHILQSGVHVSPRPAVTAGLDLFHYRQERARAAIAGDRPVDNGGHVAETNGESRDLGDGIDVRVGHESASGVTSEIVAGVFFPGDAYRGGIGGRSAVIDVRAGVRVQF